MPPAVAEPATVTLGELQHAVSRAVPLVGVPDGIVDAVLQLRAALRHAELAVSDRRWKQAVGMLQASAPVKVERPTGRMTLTRGAWSARLCPGRCGLPACP